VDSKNIKMIFRKRRLAKTELNLVSGFCIGKFAVIRECVCVCVFTLLS